MASNILTAEMSEATAEIAAAFAFPTSLLNPHLDRGMKYVYPKYVSLLFLGTHLLAFSAVNIFHPHLYKVITALASTNRHADWLFTGGDSPFQSGVTLRSRWFWISWREYAYFDSMVNCLKPPSRSININKTMTQRCWLLGYWIKALRNIHPILPARYHSDSIYSPPHMPFPSPSPSYNPHHRPHPYPFPQPLFPPSFH